MRVLKRKSRMISFRVSEEEYAGLKSLCVNEGARSVSDMARDAVHRLKARDVPANQQFETLVQLLQHRVEALDQEVKRLGMALYRQPVTNGGSLMGNGHEER
jgi:hypothetical protein